MNHLTKPLHSKNISMIVCDMAGTIINENGIIYQTINKTLLSLGINSSEYDMRKWGGRDKFEIIKDSIHENISCYEKRIDLYKKAQYIFPLKLEEEYFVNNKISLMDEKIFDLFDVLRINGIKVTLNTGYPKNIQNKIIQKFNLDLYVDDYISSEEVVFGRPYPYMIYNLMERNYVINPNNVIKIGDTINDIKEGKNANCGMTIGVLSGHNNSQQLHNAGADIIYNNIMDLNINNLKDSPFLL